MPRVKKPAKVKEPIRLRMKELADGSKSLYLDIYRDGKRTYEYLKMYIIPETDSNARKQNQVTMNAANAIKSKRIIELTNGEAGIENREKVFLLDWMETYKENQAKRGKKDGNQIKVTIRILKDFAGERDRLEHVIEDGEKQMRELEERIAIGDNRRALVEKYMNIEHLNREMVDTLIDYVTVGRRAKGTKTVPVEIHWNF